MVAIGLLLIPITLIIGENDSKNPIQLLEAKEREVDNHKFYDLEYSVNLENKSRHEFATVVVDRGYLYTLAASSSEQRWLKMQDIYKRVVNVFFKLLALLVCWFSMLVLPVFCWLLLVLLVVHAGSLASA